MYLLWLCSPSGDILGMGPRKAPVKLSLYYFSVDLFGRSYNATHTAEGGEIMVKHCAIVLFLIPDNWALTGKSRAQPHEEVAQVLSPGCRSSGVKENFLF